MLIEAQMQHVTLDNYFQTGVEVDLPEATRFISGVVKLIRKRLFEAENETDPSQPAVFLLKPNILAKWRDIEPKRIPMLDNGLTQLTGRVWFVGPVVAAGKFIEVSNCDDDHLFQIITDELKLGDVPAILFDPRPNEPAVRFYHQGLNYTECVKVVGLCGRSRPTGT